MDVPWSLLRSLRMVWISPDTSSTGTMRIQTLPSKLLPCQLQRWLILVKLNLSVTSPRSSTMFSLDPRRMDDSDWCLMGRRLTSSPSTKKLSECPELQMQSRPNIPGMWRLIWRMPFITSSSIRTWEITSRSSGGTSITDTLFYPSDGHLPLDSARKSSIQWSRNCWLNSLTLELLLTWMISSLLLNLKPELRKPWLNFKLI